MIVDIISTAAASTAAAPTIHYEDRNFSVHGSCSFQAELQITCEMNDEAGSLRSRETATRVSFVHAEAQITPMDPELYLIIAGSTARTMKEGNSCLTY